MAGSCARAVQLGLPSIAFTEHAEFTRPIIDPRHRELIGRQHLRHLRPDGVFAPPELDLAGYLAGVRPAGSGSPGCGCSPGWS